MNYSDPKLRDLLAGEYALGLMPPRARARFERLMAADAGLERLVAEWIERLAPIDAGAAPVMPSPRVWRAIERETQLRAAPPAPRVRAGLFEFWPSGAGSAWRPPPWQRRSWSTSRLVPAP